MENQSPFRQSPSRIWCQNLDRFINRRENVTLIGDHIF